MAVVIEFRWLGESVQATLDNRKWTCDNPRILRAVKAASALYPGGPEIPYPDRYRAEFVIERLSFLKGRITHLGPPPPIREGVYHGSPSRSRRTEDQTP